MTEDKVPDIPPEKVDLTRTARGPAKRGELRNMYGGDVRRVEDYPEDYTPLEMMNWYNYSLRTNKNLPLFAEDPASNRRLWEDNLVESMLDHTPTHEIHARDLPDYHYFSPIQNEIHHKPKVTKMTDLLSEYHRDQTDLPRFARSGLPKTPLQEQDWYVPLNQEGRYDWRENVRQNGYTASLLDAKGFDKRIQWFPVQYPSSAGMLTGFRLFAAWPNHHKCREQPLIRRTYRIMNGSTMNFLGWFFIAYSGVMIGASYSGRRYKALVHDNEMTNYDIAFQTYARDKGGYHGLV